MDTDSLSSTFYNVFVAFALAYLVGQFGYESVLRRRSVALRAGIELLAAGLFTLWIFPAAQEWARMGFSFAVNYRFIALTLATSLAFSLYLGLRRYSVSANLASGASRSGKSHFNR